MLITTLNLYGFFNDWQARQRHIARYLAKIQPDVVFFQEVVFLPDTNAFTLPHLLNQSLAYDYEFIDVTRLQSSPFHDAYREGLAMLSRFPVVRSETLVLKQHPDDHLQRIVQLVDLRINDRIVKFANVHFAEKPAHAKLQFDEFFDILESRNEQRIICGDFNIPSIDHIPKGYVSSGRYGYISHPSDDTKIDYILLPKGYYFESLNTSPDNLSDHRALTAQIDS